MKISRNALCIVYAIIGVFAIVGSWANVLGVLGETGFWEGTARFWKDVLVNESSRFITVDLLFLTLSVAVWMVLESRRLKMPGVWGYVAFGLLIGISFAVPAFLIHRERVLKKQDGGGEAGTMRAYDAGGLALLGVVFTVFAVVAVMK